MYFQVPKGKKGIGGSGYAGEPSKVAITRPDQTKAFKKFQSRAKSRQEVFHSRLKRFNNLKYKFRHGKKGRAQAKIDLHKSVVESVAVLIQYDYDNGNPPFSM